MKAPLLMLLLAGVAYAASVEAGDESPLDAGDRRAFAWFDGLPLPSCAGRPYVRVTTTPKRREPFSYEGFLLSETPTDWVLLWNDESKHVVPRNVPEWAATLERLDLRSVIEAEIVRMRATEGGHLAMGAALALARRAAANGSEKVAHALLAAARNVLVREENDAGRPIEDVAAEHFDVTVIWKCVLDFGDASVSRARLLEEMTAYAKSFPKSGHHATADEATRMLTSMLVEDATHVRLTEEAFAKLPAADRAAELIFRLRDQNGGQFSQPGSPSIFFRADAEDDTTSPGVRLLAMGYDAVPQLIEALTDTRFTRTVGYWRDFMYSHYVVRIGDAALELLERVTHQRFFRGEYTAASMVKDGKEHEVQAKYRAWWAEASGFVAPLRALASETDPVRREVLARALPDRGPGLIVGAPESAVWGTKRFAEAVPKLGPEAAKELLRALIDASPHARTKSMAAWALLDLGEHDAVTRMIALWKSMDATARVDRIHGAAVVSFLASCGDEAAVRALFDGLELQPPSVREMIVLAFDRGGMGAVRGLAADDGGGLDEPWTLVGPASDLIEDGLVARLDDLESDPLSMVGRQAPLADFDPAFDAGRRIADQATRVLALRWPEVYATKFVPVRPADEWDELRSRFLSTWKARRAAGASK